MASDTADLIQKAADERYKNMVDEYIEPPPAPRQTRPLSLIDTMPKAGPKK